MIILDQDFSQLSLDDQNTYMLTIIGSLLGSVALDSEDRDCMEVFDQYDWMPKTDADKARFNELQNDEFGIKTEYLDEFMDMVSLQGEHHIYAVIRRARKLFDTEHALSSSGSNALLEKHNMLTVSTGHISESDRDLLEDVSKRKSHPLTNRIFAYEYGFVIRRIMNECSYQEFKGLGLSVGALELIVFAMDQGFDMIEFDSDGPKLEGFEVFDW